MTKTGVPAGWPGRSMKGRRAMIFGRRLSASVRHQAAGGGHRLDHRRCARMRDVGHREAEMEPGRVAHGRIAAGNVGMDGVAGLDIGEGADDHPPDALHRIERQEAPVTLGERPHHRGLASGTEGGAQARLGGLLGGDQPVDDGAALHEQPVHRLVDAVDLLAQIGKVGRGLLGGHGLGSSGSGAFLWLFWPGLSSLFA